MPSTRTPSIKQTKVAQEANRCAVSAQDCEAAVAYLAAYAELQEKDNESQTGYYFTHREGLLIAAVVAYSRAFTKSLGEPFAAARMDVDKAKVFEADPAKLALHDRVLEMRNKAVAHSDWKYRKSELEEITEDGGVVRMHSVVAASLGIDIALFSSIAWQMTNHFRAEAFARDIAQRPSLES